ncbi:MAG: hypothetical protein JNM27_18455 [Leptospirales bacterium]|nr:hypothetical protein [Leptospirales bacterium]
MNRTMLLILLSVLSGCVTLVPIEQRSYSEIVEQTGRSRLEAFHRTLVWLGRRNITTDIQLKDEYSGRLIARVSIEGCAPDGYLATESTPSTHEFDFDFQAKDGRVRIIVQDIRSYSVVAQYKTLFGPRDVTQATSTLQKCIRGTFVQPLIRNITVNNETW